MSTQRPARPTLATVLGIWLIVVFCSNSFSLASLFLLKSLRPDTPQTPPLQLALLGLSLLLALAGGITLLQMKAVSWQILVGRVIVDLVSLILVVAHPAALPASVANNPNASAITSMAKTGGAIFGGIMLLVNLGIALYARNATTAVATVESAPAV